MPGPTKPKDFFAPRSDRDLSETFDQRRRGVTDPTRLVAIELQNISDALLEVLKRLRGLDK